MKKTILLLAVAFGITNVFAQDLKSKKDEPILPEAGDWALSIDAAPVLNYFGGFLSNAGAVSPAWGYPGTPLAITGKYFKDDKTAYRAMVRLGFGSTTTNAYSEQDGQTTPDPSVTVKDSWKASYHNIILGAGIEMRKGKTRLQGYYGGMFMIGFGGSDNKYTYGNSFSKTNLLPTRKDFGNDNLGNDNYSAVGPTYNTQDKAGSTMMIGLRGFIGAEYFLFPKISIGAEFGWGLFFSHRGDGSTTKEYWDGVNNALKTQTIKNAGTSTFGFDTDVNGQQVMPTGTLNLTMHF